MPFRRSLALLALAFSAGFVAPAVAQSTLSAPRNISASVHRDIASVSQETVLSGDTTIYMAVAPLTSSSRGFGLGKLATKLEYSPFGAMPTMNIPNPVSQTQALEIGRTWMKDHMPAFKTAMSAWMKTKGISMGFYNYTQQIVVTTSNGTKRKAVAFNASMDVNGRASFGDPKIVDSDPTLVEAHYVPLRSAEGIPDGWKYPDAGKVRWRLLNKRYEVISDWRVVDVQGAYDTPVDSEDPDAGLRCLIDKRNSGCLGGKPDVRQFVDEAGATYGLVTYIRELEPVYDDNGDGTLSPRSAISVDQRVWNCMDYINKGAYGFVLNLRADQYLVKSDGNPLAFQKVAEYEAPAVSPTQTYEKKVPVSALNGVHPSSVIISPLENDNSIWPRSDAALMKGVIYVSPVVSTGGSGEITGAAFAGDMAVRESNLGNGTREYYIGTVGDNYWRSGVHDRTVTFNMTSPESLEEMKIIQVGFDDWLLVNVNGTTVFIGPRGGNMLEMNYGVNESLCNWNGGGWTCATPGAWAHPGDYNEYTGQITCPAGTVLTIGPHPYGGYDDYVRACFTIAEARNYGACDADTESYPARYYCTTGKCGPGMVQYLTQPNGYNQGCSYPELSRSWNYGVDIDLRPYLKTGSNTIYMRTIVAGGGEGWIRLRTRTCGGSLGLGTEAPPPPTNSGVIGVTNTLNQQLP